MPCSGQEGNEGPTIDARFEHSRRNLVAPEKPGCSIKKSAGHLSPISSDRPAFIVVVRCFEARTRPCLLLSTLSHARRRNWQRTSA